MLLSFFRDFGSGSATPGSHWLLGIGAATAGLIAAEQLLLFRGLRRPLVGLYSSQSWWDYLKSYKGLFCKDVQKEIQYTSLLAAHHLFGGGLMLQAYLTGQPEWFAMGALVELADDIHDSYLMLMKKWPFGDDGKTDMKLTTIMLIHHLGGILAVVPGLVNGIHLSPHVQKLGAALLGAGGVSLVVLTSARTRDRRVPAQARQCAGIWLAGCGFYVYCRFYVFPVCMLAILREDYASMSPLMRKAFTGFGATMSVFNVLILFDVLENTGKRCAEAWRMTFPPKQDDR